MARAFATPSEVVLSARGVRIGHGNTVVLDHVDLDIRSGEIFGIVGPARAGKTDLLETLIGLRRPLAGQITLLGSPDPAALEVRQRVGSSLRPSTVERRTTVEEALALCASLYDTHTDIDALMREVGLLDVRSRYRERLAPHELARLSLAMGLVSDPLVLFADEPTRELDPAGRHDAWTILRRRRDAGVAIVLSTNLMDEAERLCDRVAILGAGRVLAVDTPARLVAAAGAPGRLIADTSVALPASAFATLPGIADVVADGTTVHLLVTDPLAAVQGVAAVISASGAELGGLRFSRATLEDRFAELVRAQVAPARTTVQR